MELPNSIKTNQELKEEIKYANHYKKKLEGIVKYQELPEGSYNAHHLFVIEVKNRDELYHQLRAHNIYTQIHYIPVHTLPYYAEIGYSGADLRHAENYYQKCLSLPMYPTLTEDELSFVIQKVIDICGK